MNARISKIEYFLPETILTNEQLIQDFPEWSVEKIVKKTGIHSRRIASDKQTASDLAYGAAQALFKKEPQLTHSVDYIIFCTQSPDYKLPTSACILQDRLGLSKECGAIDINQGCSGFVYSLGLAQSLIVSGQATKVLVLTAETYSKYINIADKSVRTLFGDAGAAVIVEQSDNDKSMHSFTYSTDGRGATKLIVPDGGARRPICSESKVITTDKSGNQRTDADLYMDGGDVFTFTLTAVKAIIDRTLEKANLKLVDIDHFILHQPNKFMLDQLKSVCGIPQDKLHRNYTHIGNTVSSTIPILLKDTLEQGKINSGDKILFCGFGVGYSAAAAILEW